MGAGGGESSGGKQSRSQRKHSGKFKSRNQASESLMLTSMLDILVCVLFFLLKNYSSVVSDFAASKDISLPSSSSMVPPGPCLHLVVTQKSIILDNNEIARVVNGDVERKELWKDGVTILRLAQELKAQKDRSQFQKGDKESWTGTIILQADKALNFNLLKKVIYTAGISDFVNLKLAVLKKEDT